MSWSELRSLAKKTNGVASPQGDSLMRIGGGRRERKPVETFGNYAQASASSTHGARKTAPSSSSTDSGGRSKKSRSSSKGGSASARRAQPNTVSTFDGHLCWPSGAHNRFFGFWSVGDDVGGELSFEFECEQNESCSRAPCNGSYSGQLDVGGGEVEADSMVLEFAAATEGTRDASAGWSVTGEGSNRLGAYTVEGHVSAGGVARFVRKGAGVPTSSSSSKKRRSAEVEEASFATEVATASREERKRRREEAHAAAVMDEALVESMAVVTESAQFPSTDLGSGTGSTGTGEAADKEVAAPPSPLEPARDPVLEPHLLDDFPWAQEAQSASKVGGKASKSKASNDSAWLVSGHHWLGERVRVPLYADATGPVSGTQLTVANFVDGFVVAWRPSKRGDKARSKTMWQAAMPNEAYQAAAGEGGAGGGGASVKPFVLQAMVEEEVAEGMKMGGKRRAAVVKTKDRRAVEREAAEARQSEAEEKKDMELVIRCALKALQQAEALREEEEQKDVSVTAGMLKRALLGEHLKRDRKACHVYLHRALDVLVGRGKVKLVGGKAEEGADQATAFLADDAEKLGLRYRTVQALEAERLREEHESELQRRYQACHGQWPAWEFSLTAQLAKLNAGNTDGGPTFDAGVPTSSASSTTGGGVGGESAVGESALWQEAEQEEAGGEEEEDEEEELRAPLNARPAVYFFGLEQRETACGEELGLTLAHLPRRGWHRELRLRKAPSGQASSKVDIHYYGPDGTQLRSRNEVANYLAFKFVPPGPLREGLSAVATADTGAAEEPASAEGRRKRPWENGEAGSDFASSSASNEPKAPSSSSSALFTFSPPLDIETDFDFARHPDLVVKARAQAKGASYENAAVTRRVGEMWAELGKSEQSRFEAFAAEDVERFQQENEVYEEKLAKRYEKYEDEDGPDDGDETSASFFAMLPTGMSRRRNRVNYTETSQRLADVIPALIQHIKAESSSLLEAALARSSSDEARSQLTVPAFGGATLVEVLAAMERLQPDRVAANALTAFSFRPKLGTAYRSGMLRRRVAGLQGDHLGAAALPAGHWLRTEAALRSLVVSVLQVGSDSLGPYDIAPLDDGEGPAPLPALSPAAASGLAEASSSVDTAASSSSSSSSSSSPSPSSPSSSVGGGCAAAALLLELPEDPRIGCRAYVWWAGEQSWFSGKCLDVEPGGGVDALCLVEYDDGNTLEWVRPSQGGVWYQNPTKHRPWVAAADTSDAGQSALPPSLSAVVAAGAGSAAVLGLEVYPVQWVEKPEKWVRVADKTLTALRKDKKNALFLNPVPLDTPRYLEFVAKPTDLTTVQQNLNAAPCSRYPTYHAFQRDVELVFRNCMAYNANGSPLHTIANNQLYKFQTQTAPADHASLGIAPPPQGRGKAAQLAAHAASKAAAASEAGDSSAAATAADDGTIEIEIPYTLNEIVEAIAESGKLNTDSRSFSVPPGWCFDPLDGYTPADDDSSAVSGVEPFPRVGKDRSFLEELLEDRCINATGNKTEPPSSMLMDEKEGSRSSQADGSEMGLPGATPQAAAAVEVQAKHSSGGPWLGRVVHGEWQVQQRYLSPALAFVLAGLVRSGHVELVETEGPGGRLRKTWIAANRYLAGVPPEKEKAKAREPREAKKVVQPWEQDTEHMSEFEKHRLANMQRNQAFLAGLGLA